MSNIEHKIISGLLHDEEYCRKVAPFIEPSYFSDHNDAVIAHEITKFFNKYNKLPTKDIIKIELANRKDISDQDLGHCVDLVANLSHEPIKNRDWLIEKSEKFCRDRAIYNAILDSIKIIDGREQKLSQDSIPKILQDALAVSFDTNIGHDYINNAEERFEFYHRKEEKVAFDIDLLNKITSGGLSKKTLSCLLAETGGGKSLVMCHMAAAALLQGNNVLYITMEMAEERIGERIDANLLNLTMNELHTVDKDVFNNKILKVQDKTQGKLIIKEYPTASAHSGHFRALIEELKMKRDFIPDIVIIDYLNICASARMKLGGSVNTYSYIKSIAEELRGLAIEYNIPILTATQSNRSGFSNSDVDMTNVSECIFVDENVTLRDGNKKKIQEVNIGDQIISNDGYKTVLLVHHKKIKQCFKITLKSGKSITVSADHVFPTNRGRISMNLGGLTIGDKLNTL